MSSVSSSVAKGNYFIPTMPPPSQGRKTRRTFFSQLNAIRQYIKSPLETFTVQQFEEPFTSSTLFGKQSIYIADPELIRHCFVDNASNYIHSPLRQAILKPALREGLLTTEGAHWRQSRKALSPVFIPKSVNRFGQAMLECSEGYLSELAGHPEPVLFDDHMSRLTLMILSETLFSGEINEYSEEMLEIVNYFMDNLAKPHLFDLLQAPQWVPRLSKIRGQAVIQRLRDLVVIALNKRKERKAAGEDVPKDFLTLLLEAEADGTYLTQDEIIDNILTFIGAGHETTARGVTWTLYLLSHSPDFQEKVYEEIDNLDLDNTPPEKWMQLLPWTTASFEEAMRLYPPAPIITRNAVKDDRFKDYFIPAGSTIVMAAWLLHHHKILWEHPERFDPERFYGENRAKIDRFAYLPFGVGMRVCIGARFAMQEAVIMLATLLRRFRFEYAGAVPPYPELRITLQPHNGMPMKITERQS